MVVVIYEVSIIVRIVADTVFLYVVHICMQFMKLTRSVNDGASIAHSNCPPKVFPLPSSIKEKTDQLL